MNHSGTFLKSFSISDLNVLNDLIVSINSELLFGENRKVGSYKLEAKDKFVFNGHSLLIPDNISKAVHFLLEGALSYFIFTDMFAHKCAFIQNYDSCLFHKPQFL